MPGSASKLAEELDRAVAHEIVLIVDKCRRLVVALRTKEDARAADEATRILDGVVDLATRGYRCSATARISALVRRLDREARADARRRGRGGLTASTDVGETDVGDPDTDADDSDRTYAPSKADAPANRSSSLGRRVPASRAKERSAKRERSRRGAKAEPEPGPATTALATSDSRWPRVADDPTDAQNLEGVAVAADGFLEDSRGLGGQGGASDRRDALADARAAALDSATAADRAFIDDSPQEQGSPPASDADDGDSRAEAVEGASRDPRPTDDAAPSAPPTHDRARKRRRLRKLAESDSDSLSRPTPNPQPESNRSPERPAADRSPERHAPSSRAHKSRSSVQSIPSPHYEADRSPERPTSSSRAHESRSSAKSDPSFRAHESRSSGSSDYIAELEASLAGDSDVGGDPESLRDVRSDVRAALSMHPIAQPPRSDSSGAPARGSRPPPAVAARRVHGSRTGRPPRPCGRPRGRTGSIMDRQRADLRAEHVMETEALNEHDQESRPSVLDRITRPTSASRSADDHRPKTSARPSIAGLARSGSARFKPNRGGAESSPAE